MFGRIRSGMAARYAAYVIAGALAPFCLGAQNIEPSGPPLSGMSFTGVGPGWYSDVGQSFVAGGAYLSSFSFWFGSPFSSNFAKVGDPLSGVELIPMVMAWDGSKGVDNVLFQGGAVLVAGLTSYQEFTFSTGSLALSPGDMYIAFVQAVNDGVHTGNFRVGVSDLAGGGAAADNVQGATPQSLTDPWTLNNSGVTATFAATFTDAPVTATPEPASMMLLATGMAGLFGANRFRRKRR